MKSTPISSSLFIRNRQKLAKNLDSGSMAVLFSAKRMPRNGDQFYPFRQDSDFFYLTGIVLEETILVLSPNHKDPLLREVLFIPKPTSKTELWSGPALSPKEAASLSGIKEVMWAEEADSFLKRMLMDASVVYSDRKEKFDGDHCLTDTDRVEMNGTAGFEFGSFGIDASALRKSGSQSAAAQHFNHPARKCDQEQDGEGCPV